MNCVGAESIVISRPFTTRRRFSVLSTARLCSDFPCALATANMSHLGDNVFTKPSNPKTTNAHTINQCLLYYTSLLLILENYWASRVSERLWKMTFWAFHLRGWRHTSTTAIASGGHHTSNYPPIEKCAHAETTRRSFTFWPNQQSEVRLQFRPAPKTNHHNVYLRWPNFAWCIYYTCATRMHLSRDKKN